MGSRGPTLHAWAPIRLVASGLATPGAVKRAALVAFGVAGVAGLALAAVAGWWPVALGAPCVGAAWFYTGGPRPYGYVGLGEVSVFVFFGLVATTGTAYVQTDVLTSLEVLAAVPVGLMAVALLVVNNLRDIPGDSMAGKRTLAVGRGAGRYTPVLRSLRPAGHPARHTHSPHPPVGPAGLGALPLAFVPVRAVALGGRRAGTYPGLGGHRTGTAGPRDTARDWTGPMNQAGLGRGA